MPYIQFSSVAQSCPTLCNPMDCSKPGFSVHYQLPELAQISYPSSQCCHPAISCSVVPFSSCLQSFPAIRVFSDESVLRIRWPKYWSFSFGISPSKENSELISFTGLNSLQSKGLSRVFSNTPFQKHQCFGTQPSLWSNSLIQTWLLEKTIALTRWTFVGKVRSLLFNMLSRLVIAFLPRSKHLLSSWLQSPFAVILEPPELKSLTVSIVFPSTCHDVMGPDAMILVF